MDAVLRALIIGQQRKDADPIFKDPESLLRQYGRILSAVPGAGDIPFAMWPHLPQVIAIWQKHRLTVMLKSRQVGISWLVAAYALCVARQQIGSNVLVLSKGEDDAADLLDKARFIESRLPPHLRARKGRDNRSELEFPDSRARIRALPATKDAGRSQTATLVVLDEFAFHGYAEDNFLAIKPTIDAGGQMIVVSTANGYGGAFSDLWDAADGMATQQGAGGVWTLPDGRTGPNGFFPVFVDWTADPARDQAWHTAKRQELSSDKIAQEYPSDPMEAFLQSGRPVFDKQALDDLAQTAKPALPKHQLPTSLHHLDGLQVYRLPEKGQQYLLGADVSQGLARGDASCAVVLDRRTHEEVAHLHERTPPDVFADHLDTLAQTYSGLLGVERQGPGYAVLAELRKRVGNRHDQRYHLHYERRVLREPTVQGMRPQAVTEVGWLTTASSKPKAIAEWEAALRRREAKLNTPNAIAEHRFYRYEDDGKTNAPEGKHDDCVMAAAIAYQMRLFIRLDTGPITFQASWS